MQQVGLAGVPVYLHAAADDDEALRAERLIEQVVLNEHRADLTDAQRVRGINQLLLAGLAPAKIAKKLATPRRTVDVARTVQASAAAMSALDSSQLTLEEALTLCDFIVMWTHARLGCQSTVVE